MTVLEGVDIQSVVFAPGQIEISYTEQRDVNPSTGILEVRTLVVPTEKVEEAYREAVEVLQQLVDAALLARRNPVKMLRR